MKRQTINDNDDGDNNVDCQKTENESNLLTLKNSNTECLENYSNLCSSSSPRTTRRRSKSELFVAFRPVIIISTVFIISTIIITYETPKKVLKNFEIIQSAGQHECHKGIGLKFQEAILAKHNEIRSQVALGKYQNGPDSNEFLPTASRMSKLKWDCKLEKMAQKRAEKCNIDQPIMDEQMNGIEDTTGENSFYYFVENENDHLKTVVDAIDEMGSEITKVGLKSVSMKSFDRRVGHATQMIWENTTNVGCAIKKCQPTSSRFDGAEFSVAVCKYYPRGNIFNWRQMTNVYTVGEPATQCPHLSFVDDTSGLCLIPEVVNRTTMVRR